MIHAAKNQLQRASLCSDDQVNPGQLFFELFLQLGIHQQQQRYQARAQGKEQQTQGHVEWLVGQVLPAKLQYIHTLGFGPKQIYDWGNKILRSKRSFRRPS